MQESYNSLTTLGKRFSQHNIRTKLSLVFSLVVGFISLFVYFYFPQRLAENDLRSLEDKMQSIAKMTAYRVAPALFFEDSLAATEALASARQDSDIVYMVVSDGSGRVFAAYNLTEADRALYRNAQTSTIALSGQEIMVTATPINHNQHAIGTFSIGLSLANLHAHIKATRLTILVVSLLLFIVGTIAVFGLTTFLMNPLLTMVNTVEQIAKGDMTQRASVSSRDEVGQLAEAFNGMVSSLASAQLKLREINADLERRVQERTRKLTESEKALSRSQVQLRALNAHLQKVREEERARIAREIHDELGQTLTALNLDVAVLEKQLLKAAEKYRVPLPIEMVRSLLGLVESSIRDVRRLAFELRPDVLDSLGLPSALDWQAKDFQARSGIPCDIELPVEAFSVDQETSTAIFRILQESLTNIVRHAQAKHVSITLKESEGMAILEIRDDGKGINEEEIVGKRSIGLLGMRERAMALGGEFYIAGSPGNGTQVTVRMPRTRKAEI